MGLESAFMVTVRNASCTTVDPRNSSGDGDMATMMVVVGDGGGGGKYGTPGAGVIIYLAPEIGPADTAGRFNGRTMLELTKTKTKHQLGDFFFHFSFASFTFARSLRPLPSSLLSRSLSLSLVLAFFLRASALPASLRPRRRRGAAKVRTTYICVVHLCHPRLTSSRTSGESAHPLSQPARPPLSPPSPRLLSSRGNEVAHFKPRTRPLAPR